MNIRSKNRDQGFVLVSVLLIVSALAALIATYSTITRIDLATMRSSRFYADSFYTAESGLNIRAQEFRSTFQDFQRPSGISPSTLNPCNGSDEGSGDFACQTYNVNSDTVYSYVKEDSNNPYEATIPVGEPFQNLKATEYRYDVFSKSVRPDGSTGAILGLRFKSRLIPVFQFNAFYENDLEISSATDIHLNGPLHSNNNVYLDSASGQTMLMNGQLTARKDIYRGYKLDGDCRSGTLQVYDPDNPLTLDSTFNCASGGNRVSFANKDFSDWNGVILQQVDEIKSPPVSSISAGPGNALWDTADLRIALHLSASTTAYTPHSSYIESYMQNLDTSSSANGIEVRNSDHSVNVAQSATLNSCTGNMSGEIVRRTVSFYNFREFKRINMLEVDVQGLLNCLHSQSLVSIDDATDRGLIIHLTVDGPDSAGLNGYGVRLRNGSELASSISGAPDVKGLTFVSDQALYVKGDYNTVNKKPAALLTDSFNVLSNSWDLPYDGVGSSSTDDYAMFYYHNYFRQRAWNSSRRRNTSDTTINAAILSASSITGGANGVPGHDHDDIYSGGLQNFPRLHEDWGYDGSTLTLLGSMVSLSEPLHVDGNIYHGSNAPGYNYQYLAPTRNFSYDTDFNDPDNLPPGTLNFVYLRQILFSRDFEEGE